MAIKGLTDIQAALPSVGMLRKGDVKTPKKPGRDLEYFRFTSDNQEALSQFVDNYGAEPQAINVFLPYKTTDENMDSWIELWVAGGLIYRSDGEMMVLYRDGSQYNTEPKPDPHPAVLDDGKRADKSGQVGRLSVIIPELGRLATVTALTTSKNDILKLTRQLRAYEALTGDLRGVPFVLRRRQEKVSTPGPDGKRIRRVKWMLSIETKTEWSMAKMLSQQEVAYPELTEKTSDSASDFVINQLPANITAPFDEIETEQQKEPEQPKAKPTPKAKPAPAATPDKRKPAHPVELKGKVETYINYLSDGQVGSKYFDNETFEPLPVKLHPFGKKTAGFIAAKMTKVLDDNKDIYHAVLEYLTGCDSATKLTAPQAAALFRLMFNGGSETLSFETPVTDIATIELKAVAALVADTEQAELFDEPAEQVAADLMEGENEI